MHWELSSSCLFFLAVFFFFLIIASDDCNMCVGLGWRTASTWYKILVALRFGLITVRSFFLSFFLGGWGVDDFFSLKHLGYEQLSQAPALLAHNSK